MEHKEFEQKIMKRVMRMYYLKKVINPLMFKVYALTAATVGIFSLVSVTNVFKNMPSLLEAGNVLHFASHAITNTELSVQLVLGIAILVGVLLIRDTIKNFAYAAKFSTQHLS